MKIRKWVCTACIIAVLAITPIWSHAQNVVSGEITGTVTDTTGAVVPNATVKLVNSATGAQATTTSSASGGYRFPLLQPGTYRVTATASGFSSGSRDVTVVLGQVTATPIQLAVAGQQQTVEVTAEAPLLQSENANQATSFTTQQIETLPNSGGDLTNFAFQAPGVVLNAGSGFGYGNFTSNGMPGTSNLLTVNGNDYNDPYLNLNNSGSSNMSLGTNEVQEVSVVQNGYTAQYGRMAGANENLTTKSGTNSFHGNAMWDYNDAIMNANDWFNNHTSPKTPYGKAISNQWAGSVGGPIIKNKLFFFYDNEGIRYLLPGGGDVYIPTPQFATAVLANLQAKSPASVPFYQNLFTLYAGSSGASRATNVTSSVDTALGCGDFASGGFGTSIPCARTFRSSVNSLNTEGLQTLRIDFNAWQNDKLNFRYKRDRGVQATSTDPINRLFSANSIQPEDDGQLTWTHILNGSMVNQFIASGLYYSAIFGPPNASAALAAFPTTIGFIDGLYNTLGYQSGGAFPQGRNVAQYQVIDDFSWTRGNHGIKFGINFRRNDISSFAAASNVSGNITEASMTDFFNGIISGNAGSSMSERFSAHPENPVAFYSLGAYLQDEWRATPNLKLTLAFRADRNSNIACRTHCFARPSAAFEQMNHAATTPYKNDIQSGLSQAFPTVEPFAYGPRLGFAWNLFGSNTTVLRGGVGLFSDLYPAFLADRVITNIPNTATYTITDGPIAPGAAGSVFAQAIASNAAFTNSYNSGGTLASIRAALPTFTAPTLNVMPHQVINPKWLEWNLQLEQAFGANTSLNLNYAGNHGYDLFTQNFGLNTFCTTARCPKGFAAPGAPGGILPASATDTRFGIVTQFQNNGISNYDGLTAALSRRFSHGFQGSFNYTWSHTLDDVSNGGLEYYAFYRSVTRQIDPHCLRCYNYGSSDYDFRHFVSGSYFYNLPFKTGNALFNSLVGGWVLSENFYWRSPVPFSVLTTGTRGLLSNGTSMTIPAAILSLAGYNCSRPSGTTVSCLSKTQFTSQGTTGSPVPAGFGNQGRNMLRGPRYFDSDVSLMKNFKIRERLAFEIGGHAYNVFNHPNFEIPHNSLTTGTFGQFFTTIGQPNSPYGNFQGANVNGRVIVGELQVKF